MDHSRPEGQVSVRRPLIVAGLLLLAAGLFIGPIPQDPGYHQFADQRAIAGIPHGINVLSNIPFLVVAGMGFFILRTRSLSRLDRDIGRVFFLSLALVGLGSGWYHLAPDNHSLVWDRLPMTLAFMSFATLVLGRYGSHETATRWFPWLLATGVASVLIWILWDDLRLYIVVQFGTLLAIAVVLCLNRGANAFWPASILFCYVLAKAFEYFDEWFFLLSGETVSGHTLKHLVAAGGAVCVIPYLSGSSAGLAGESSDP